MRSSVTKKKLAPEDVPEVAALEEVIKEIQAFNEEHVGVLDRLSDLYEEYNAALDAADREMRRRSIESGEGLSCGPFRFKNFTSRISADKAVGVLGEDTFLNVAGGSSHTETVYEVDKHSMLQAIKSGKISKDDAAQFLSVSVSYSKIEKGSLL